VTDPDAGSLLARISIEMVRAQKEYFGKGPVKAKSYFIDDLLLIVMRGGLTTAEKTMLEFDQPDRVRDFRQVFENEMAERLTGMIEDLTGRKVLTYQSQVLFDPDIIIEVFVFEDRLPDDQIEATAEGQLAKESVGEVTTREEPAASGQD
jgi:uncharacterized protein YbcI